MNLTNRTIFCKDNLDIMRGINSKCVDLIYLDPPFNKKKVFHAPVGSNAEGASFRDIFYQEDVKDEWLKDIEEDYFNISQFIIYIKVIEGRTSYNFCYLAYMAIRLIEMKRILKDTGSIYLHCDPTMSHYLKLIMDCVFGENNFRNEIIWWYDTGGMSKQQYSKKHDVILYYSCNSDFSTFNADAIMTEKNESQKKRYELSQLQGENSTYRLTSTLKYPHDVFQIHAINPKAKERMGYPTQKPAALLERIILASSNENDIVLDPFCGCATTCIAAEKNNRKWVGIDVSVKAYDLVKMRLDKEVGRTSEFDSFQPELHFYTDSPIRTDQGVDSRTKKYVYIIENKKFPDEYKVGIATNAENRLGSYNTGDPDRGYKLLFKHQTPWFRETELFIHEKYENKHEWVKGDVKAIKYDIETWQPE